MTTKDDLIACVAYGLASAALLPEVNPIANGFAFGVMWVFATRCLGLE